LNNNFKEYAKYYDVFNSEKDYVKESSYIDSIIKEFNSKTKKILDIGCGTGLHDFELANLNYDVTGIDISNNMIEIAKEKSLRSRNNVNFYLDHDQNYESLSKFDAIISLFHVVSYQITYSNLEKLFAVASKNLKSGGLFIFDYWYSPAVEYQKLEKREKMILVDGKSYTKSSEPHSYSQDIHKINITICCEDFSFNEEHLMKSFTPQDFSQFSDFKQVQNYAWMTKSKPSKNNWSAVTILRKL
jgi:predicted TPR repeat methyltransferase